MTEQETPIVREAVGVFQSERALQAAVDDLLSHGFDRSELSLLAPLSSVEKELGHGFTSVRELEDDPVVPTTAYISTDVIGDAEGGVFGGFIYVGALATLTAVVASGGAIGAAIIAAAAGGIGGGAIGAVLAKLIGQHHADYVEDQLERGGLLLWVRTWNAADEKHAVEILANHSGADVHVHDLPATHDVLDERYGGDTFAGELQAYRGVPYTYLPDGEYYISGEVLPTERDVKARIDRDIYLETLQSEAKAQGWDIEIVLADPAGVFHTPAKLLAGDLPDAIKADILRRWAYGEKQLEIASDDGMQPARNGDRLQEINLALERL
ncbi:hypothetical protein [uncultured Parasphingorhabdus sp.]|uniref:hypothetical protein n=1 Tax=uncultured Parasphingorhabdus sp. TaxID=2709694 RepID=UPI0030D96209|tara:strand:+ start:102120 stop:103094 length:975 start_codon:yes stop_codon:yes gene_type:complete